MKLPTEESISKFFKEIMFGPRFQKFWWASVVINILVVISIKYLDFAYPSSVCCCGCEANDSLGQCFIEGTYLQSYFVFKRWGALENCSILCAEVNLPLRTEISYGAYVNYTKMRWDLQFLNNDSNSLFNTSLKALSKK